MTISGAVSDIQSSVGALSGMRHAPSYPPDSTAIFPFAVSYISRTSSTQRSIGNRMYQYTITTEIHVARKDMARNVETINAYPELFSAAIWADPTLGANVDTVISCSGQLSASQWGGIDTLAWVFETVVKIV